MGIIGGMSVLDTAQLAAIYDLAGPELAEMLEEMAVRARESLGQLEVVLVGGDLAAGAEIAHQLKGSAVSMGLAAFGEGAARVEDGLRAGNLPKTEELRGLGAILEESVAAVRVYLAGA